MVRETLYNASMTMSGYWYKVRGKVSTRLLGIPARLRA